MLAGLGGDDEEAASDEESPAEEATSDEEETDLNALLASLGGDDDESETNETSDVTEPEAEAPSEEPSEEPEPSRHRQEKSGAMDNEDLDAAIQATKAATKYGDAPNSTAPTIDFAALLKPISEDEPAGGSVPFDVPQKLDEMRREVNPADFADDDPLRPEEPVRADWQGVIRLCQQTLTEKSKNLLIAARLTEALAKVHGFAGLRDGLHVFRQLINNCWDRLDPALDEDDDLEVRAPFNWLDDPDRGAVFPNTIRGLPIVIAGGERYGESIRQLARENEQGLTNDVDGQAVFNASAEQCRHAAADSAQALQELKQLVNELRMKMGGEGPELHPHHDGRSRHARQTSRDAQRGRRSAGRRDRRQRNGRHANRRRAASAAHHHSRRPVPPTERRGRRTPTDGTAQPGALHRATRGGPRRLAVPATDDGTDSRSERD